MNSPQLKNILIPLLVLVAGLCFYNLSITGFDLAYIPGDSGDARFINYILEHGYQYIIGNHDSFWKAPFMVPYGNTIALSDHLITGIPLYALFRFAGSDIETAYQLWWILVYALNFGFAYHFANKFFKNVLLASLIGFLFAFGTYNLWQLNYVQMGMRFFVPPTIYFAWKVVDTPESKYLRYLMISILLQFLSVMYIGFFLLYFTSGIIFLYMFVFKKWGLIKFYFKTELKTTLFTLLGFTSVMFLLFTPYFSVVNDVGLKLFDEVKWNLPTWKAFAYPHPSSIWGWCADTMKPSGQFWILSTFTGIIPLFVLISTPILLFLHHIQKLTLSRLQYIMGLASFIISILFIRTESGYTLYALIFKLPGINSMRVLNRYILVSFFIQLIFIGSLLKSLKPIILVPICLILIADQWYFPEKVVRTSKQELQRRTQVLVDQLDEQRNDKRYFVVFDENDSHFNTHLDAMMATFPLNKACINGYSSSCPDDFGQFFNAPNRENYLLWASSRNLDTNQVIELDRSK